MWRDIFSLICNVIIISAFIVGYLTEKEERIYTCMLTGAVTIVIDTILTLIFLGH
jgi:hypothetical protein